MRLTVSETAKLTNISVRTLHYYDEIGLLKPTGTTEAGYRYTTRRRLQRCSRFCCTGNWIFL